MFFKGNTLISHDSETPSFISNCLGPDCYTRAITYEAKLEQLKSLTKISSECRQSFRVGPFYSNHFLSLFNN